MFSELSRKDKIKGAAASTLFAAFVASAAYGAHGEFRDNPTPYWECAGLRAGFSAITLGAFELTVRTQGVDYSCHARRLG
ncbi:MAG: hypothetical protein AAF296_02980 [Pseudomonadota bacterium]